MKDRTEVMDAIAARGRRWRGLQPCCGATNPACARPPGIVYETFTGCENCGHPKSCHAKVWAGRAMTTLTDFLLARIAEDEYAVRGMMSGADPDFFWGPDRIRDECEAKRRVVLWAHGSRLDVDSVDGVLIPLASVYADHPDYREEWKP